jgi:DHA3 family macrolide efflux protein-like MFS transporter
MTGRFVALWLAQTISLLGSQLSGFAIGVWLYQETHAATLSGLVTAAIWLPQVLGAPLAGVITDRVDRRLVLLSGHAGAGLCSLGLLAVLHSQGGLPPALAITLVALASCFRAVEFPAFSAATTVLVSREALGRANGLAQLGQALPQLIAPVLAGALLERFGLALILALDAASFAIAIVQLLSLRIPRAHAEARARSALDELREAFRFVADRPGLGALLGFFAVLNVNLGMVQVAVTPLVLGFADAPALGKALSVGGLGMLAGALLMAAWGGPRVRIRGVLGSAVLQGVWLVVAGAKASLFVVSLGAFGVLLVVPMAAACTQTIWQRKVPTALQGRVFSLRMLLAGGTLPLAQIAAGPLCDRVFEPALAASGPLADSLGPLLGTGPGRGAGLLLIVLGLLTIATGLAGFAYPRLAHVEDEVPEGA